MKLNNTILKSAGDGKHGDGDGLWLYKRGTSGKWVYRYTISGRRREMGLGPYPAMTLAQARRARDAERTIYMEGGDPIAARDARRADVEAERSRTDPTLAEAVQMIFERLRGGLRGDGTRGRWMSPLNLYILPPLGKRRLSTLTHADFVAALKPIWHTKHPTATKAAHRVRRVLKGGAMLGWPCDPREIDRAVYLLGEVRRSEVRHSSVPWQEAPALYAALVDLGTLPADCVRWIMLTGQRSTPCRGAAYDEIDGDIWTVPAERIKGTEGRVVDFRCPLPSPALAIAQSESYDLPFLFFGPRGKPATDVTVLKALRRVHPSATLHGMRSTLRTWAQDNDLDREACEVQLGHKVHGEVEAAYARSDIIERRRVLLDAWAAYLVG